MATIRPPLNNPPPDLATVSDQDWAEAKRRVDVIRPLAKMPFCPISLAEEASKALELSRRRVYSLIRIYRSSGGLLTSLLPSKPSGGKGQSRLSTKVEGLIGEAIESLYLNRQRVPTSRVVEDVQRRCNRAGLLTPSESTIRRRVESIPVQEALRRRHGRRVLRAKTAPVYGAFPTPSYPLAMVQMDHTPVDVIVVDETYRQPIGRPYVTFAIDVFSRCIAGFCLTLEPPSAVSVSLCLTHAALDKDAWVAARHISGSWPIWGKPAALHVDNGAEFHSDALHRGCDQHGIVLQHRPAGQPQYGGIVERVIGTFMQLIHQLPGTTFSNVAERGDYDSESQAVLTLAELEHWLTIAIVDYYHRKPHMGIGEPPLAKYREGIRQRTNALGHEYPQRVESPRRFTLDFLPVVWRSLQRHGFMIDHIAYYSDALRSMIGDKKHGKFLIRRDPRDLSRVYVREPLSQQYLEVPYRTLSRPTITLWEHRQALKFLRERGLKHTDETAIFQAVEEMYALTQDATSKTRTTRRQAERKRQAARGASAIHASAEDQPIEPHPERRSRVTRFKDIEVW